MRNAVKFFSILIFLTFNAPTAFASRAPEDYRIAEILELSQKARFEIAALAIDHAASLELQEFARTIAMEFIEISSPVSYSDHHPQAQRMLKQISRMKSDLLSKSGLSFDRNFLEQQEIWHLRLLRLIDHDLLKKVESAELRLEIKKLKQDVKFYLVDLQTVDLPNEGLSISKNQSDRQIQ